MIERRDDILPQVQWPEEQFKINPTTTEDLASQFKEEDRELAAAHQETFSYITARTASIAND